MAPMLFASAISKGKEINVFNNGDLIRDFTYVDDIVNGTIQVIDHQPEISEKGVPAKVYNIGCSHPVKLMDFISEIEKNLGIMAKKKFYADATGGCVSNQCGYYEVGARSGLLSFGQIA